MTRREQERAETLSTNRKMLKGALGDLVNGVRDGLGEAATESNICEFLRCLDEYLESR